MLQAWLAKENTQNEQNEPLVSPYLHSITPYEWTERFDGLASRGWSAQDVDHWIWILSGEDGDTRVQRLVSTESPNPLFLVNILSRCDERFRNASSPLSIMAYTSKHYFNSPNPINVYQFLLLLRRLVHHTMRLCPRSIVTVARFTVDYVRSLSPDSHTNYYHLQCRVFNTALLLFKRPAVIQPMINMQFNWRAQKTLLVMSDNLDTPLIINKFSYESVMEVMLGMKKSKTEKAVAMRYAKSWPPYRQDFDGLDAKRTAEDDYSRTVKAGQLMKEAGYPEDHYDRALGALGGKGANSPTIQTRSLVPQAWKGNSEDRNLHVHWAMLVRATRNPQEAWKIFMDFAAETDKAPNGQVYAEMFIKLHSRPLHPNSKSLLPGDAKENFPIHDANYSEYELARLSPPTIRELYDQMISYGVKPEGYCLHVLLSNAESLEEGARYLHDAGIDPVSISSIALFKEPSYQALHKIPLLVFKSYIQLLCNLQPDRQGGIRYSSVELYRIRHAIKLSTLRLRLGTSEGHTFRPPWLIICRALARPNICVLNGTRLENDTEALQMSLDIFRIAQKASGIDLDFFFYLCRAVQKAAVSRIHYWSSIRDRGFMDEATKNGPLVPYPETIQDILKESFASFTSQVDNSENNSGSLSAPTFQQYIGPAHLHTYIRTLAFLEDTEAMKALLRWMIKHKAYINEEADRIEYRGHALIAKTLCAFQAFAGPSLSEEEREDMRFQMEASLDNGCSWRWPTLEEVDAYVQSDRSRGSELLQRRILAMSWLRSSVAEESPLGSQETPAAQQMFS